MVRTKFKSIGEKERTLSIKNKIVEATGKAIDSAFSSDVQDIEEFNCSHLEICNEKQRKKKE